MILGMPPLTLLHTLISLVGILTGAIVMWGLIKNDYNKGVTLTFLVFTIATSVTGFLFFPFVKFLPSHAVGTLSLIILAISLYALYAKRLSGSSRWIYVVTAVAAQYFNVFVLVVQLFLKVPALHELAPQQSEPPFVITQAVVLVAYLVVGFLGVKRFHPPTPV
jgi:hypothetical protein